MALSTKMQKALNDQIREELYSAYVYLSMSAYFSERSLSGCGKWMKMQSQEELEHAMRIFEFVNNCGGVVKLQALADPSSEYESTLDAFQKALKHEQKITGLIHKLYELAVEEKDYATQTLMHWFIDEQVEEEDMVGELVDKLKLIGNDPMGLFLFDQQVGEREPEDEE